MRQTVYLVLPIRSRETSHWGHIASSLPHLTVAAALTNALVLSVHWHGI